MSLWEELQWRGFYYQSTNDSELKKRLETDRLTAYVGVDPTAESLHIGHFVPLYLMCHIYRHGHFPIVLLGAGTAKVGDPSGKSKVRPLLDNTVLEFNTKRIKDQISTIFSRLNVNAQFVDNSLWLDNLGYIHFIRNIGRHFSVNRMLSFETYKKRLETGLSFLEFNYQLLQSYDFLYLFETYTCSVQFGGADQWANIVAGAELIRRVHGKEVCGYTVPLVTRSDGSKMGKTEDGALFIDASLTCPFDFYQYWRNIDDRDCDRFLKLYTFLPRKEIVFWSTLKDQELNIAKELLAYTVTSIIHGKTLAWQMLTTARAMFSHEVINTGIIKILKYHREMLSLESLELLKKITDTKVNVYSEQQHIPSVVFDIQELHEGIAIVDMFVRSGLCASKSEVRRLIQQGGARVFDRVVKNSSETLDVNTLSQNKEIILKSGKKKMLRLVFDNANGDTIN